MTTRRQASLYLDSNPAIELLRMRFNPLQAQLIPAHVTLCREDEVSDWQQLEQRLRSLPEISVSIEFGSPVREGHLVYLPAVGSTRSFDRLRQVLLEADGQRPRQHRPHITIIHPRNGECTDATYEEIVRTIKPFRATFDQVRLIQQRDGLAWQELASVGS